MKQQTAGPCEAIYIVICQIRLLFLGRCDFTPSDTAVFLAEFREYSISF